VVNRSSALVEREVRGGVGGSPPVVGNDGDGWGESPVPRRAPLDNARLGLLIFLGAETMFFAALIGGFLVLRVASVVWPPPLQPRLPVVATGLNTLCLLASSLTMARAMRALWRGNVAGLQRGLAATAALGGVFLLVQGFEWIRLVHFGLTVSSGSYGSTFYTLIGTHGLHVLGALVWLAVILQGVRGGRFGLRRPTPVAVCAMYWHYVVALWPILYALVYLT
jgi:heme/copper-type cytochrome/quinol oxidase subunit 3